MEEEKIKVIYKEKKQPGKTFAIVVLIIAVLGLMSYIEYTKYDEIMKNKDKNETKEEREELYYSEVNDLLEKIDDYNEVLSMNYPITDYKKLDNQQKLKFGIYLLTKYENTKNYYKTQDIDEILHNYFTKDFNVIYESITCNLKDGDLYVLNNGTYTIDTNHEHGQEKMNIKTFYVDSNKLDNVYKITVNILYNNYCVDTCAKEDKYYDSWNDAKERSNEVLTSLNEYEDNKDDIKKTTFTFEKENDNYLLKNIKVES